MSDENPLISRAERERTSLDISKTLHAALYELLKRLEEEEGIAPSRTALMCALVFEAVSSRTLGELADTLKQYHRAHVSDIAEYHGKVVPIRPGRPRGQKTG